MGKNKKRNIFLIMIVVIVLLGFGGYKYYNSKKYNETINSANLAMDNLEYDKAIALFNESLKYKKNGNVDDKIKLAKELKVDKQSYDKGINLMKSKKYNEAINSFKTVSKKSEKLYGMTQDKIKESTNMLISEKIKVAKENVKNKKYDEANKHLDEALKMDSSNKDAKSLKKVVAIRIKEMETLKRKQQEEEKQKLATGGKVTFEQALAMVLKDAFPDNNYIEHKSSYNGYIYYVSPDTSGINGNPMPSCKAEERGKGICYDTKKATSIETVFDNKNISGKVCYQFNFSKGGKIYDGYYVEASTGKIYKWHLGHIKCIN